MKPIRARPVGAVAGAGAATCTGYTGGRRRRRSATKGAHQARPRRAENRIHQRIDDGELRHVSDHTRHHLPRDGTEINRRLLAGGKGIHQTIANAVQRCLTNARQSLA